ncbi:MAG: hypothetical protein ACI9WU_005491 [Myxococcota bacterium]
MALDSQDRRIGWADMFQMSEQAKQEALSSYQALFDKLGVDAGNTDEFFVERLRKLAVVADAVKSLADGWDLPPTGTNHYGVGLARKEFGRALKGARVLKAKAAPGTWSISKNALGIPLYRDRGGWLLAWVPGEPLCQLRRFFISEEYDGRRYQKDTDASFSDLRWQACK